MWARRAFESFIYSNVFISGCAALMAWHTFRLFNQAADSRLTGFIFFATICSYSFHWWLTPASTPSSSRIQWLQRNRNVHLAGMFIGAIGTIYYGLFFLNADWYWLALAFLIAFLYSAPMIPHPLFRALRKIAVGKTIFLAMAWTYVTAGLPVLLSGNYNSPAFVLFFLSRYFFIYAICILFDYRDRDYDRSIGIRSLITWLDKKGITLLFSASIILSAVLTCLLGVQGTSWTDISILLLPVIITALLFSQAMKNFSDLFFYFVLDGLMALSAFLYCIASFLQT